MRAQRETRQRQSRDIPRWGLEEGLSAYVIASSRPLRSRFQEKESETKSRYETRQLSVSPVQQPLRNGGDGYTSLASFASLRLTRDNFSMRSIP